ncbi:hypothetical protein LCGC14_1601760 [marine sediment metagenome]|uniref:Uncharacterized protein n=1 Tax=marine sediment metagenome TaxID=412755 RepID=A0A0F9IAZ2_9ZZZZ
MRNKNMQAMETILLLLTLGLARIEKSKTEDFAEFCFQGLRYPCTDRNWQKLVELLGMSKILSVIAMS